MTTDEKKIQKIINKIVAEELVIHMLYMGAMVATIESHVYFKLFTDIANEKIQTYIKKLTEFAKINGYTIPFKFKEYEKYAEKHVKQLESLKTEQPAAYYIAEVIKAETDILNSYADMIELDYIPYELQMVLTQNFYSVGQYIDKLQTLKYATDAAATMYNQYM